MQLRAHTASQSGFLCLQPGQRVQPIDFPRRMQETARVLCPFASHIASLQDLRCSAALQADDRPHPTLSQCVQSSYYALQVVIVARCLSFGLCQQLMQHESGQGPCAQPTFVTKALSVNDGRSASAICVPWTSLRAVSSCMPQQSHMQAPAKCQLTPTPRNMHWSGLDTAQVSALSHGVSVLADSLALSGRPT